METPEVLQQCVRREQQMIARLRLAMTRLADAERERIWAIVAAQEAGLSIRQIAPATGVSPARMHQLLQVDEARAIPVWLSQLQDQRRAPAVQPEGVPPAPSSPGWSHLADAVEARRAGAAAATTEPVGRAGRLTTSPGTPAVCETLSRCALHCTRSPDFLRRCYADPETLHSNIPGLPHPLLAR